MEKTSDSSTVDINSFLENVLERLPAGFIYTDNKGNILHMNDQARQYSDTICVEKWLKERIIDKSEEEFTSELLLKGGCLHLNCCKADKNKGYVLLINDTPVARQIQKTSKLLLSVFHSSYDPIYVADDRADGILVNEAYTRMTGVEPQELLGRNMRDVVEEGIVSESVTLKVLKEKKPVTIVQRVKGKELVVTGNPIADEDGRITHVVTNLRDISELNVLRLELEKTKALTQKYKDELRDFEEKEGINFLQNGVIAQSKEMLKPLKVAYKVSRVDSTVLLLGESGAGKEVFAKMIHLSSSRRDKPYIKVNCSAIPHHLLEAELFGYEKGAFTGANPAGKPGLFEQADGGTIFLDEIGDMPLDLQVKLLRVLQEYEFTRVGGTKTVKVDVRVISATNADLERQIKEGKFRKDLYYRLNIVPIHIPPLRERKTDIAPLAYYFLNKTNQKFGMDKSFHPEVIHLMKMYDWPGNIREMENLVERLGVTVDQPEIQAVHLPQAFFEHGLPESQQTLKESVNGLEKRIILETISKHKTTRETAKVLGISQSTLVKKMQRLNINTADSKIHR